jgi:hypothetical protein
LSLRRATAPLFASLLAAAAILSGCGGGGGGKVDVGPAVAVPANAALYMDAAVRPTGTAEAGAKAAATKIFKTSDPGGKIVSLIEQQSKSSGHPISYQQDVAPWLGHEAALFFTSFAASDTNGAFVIETTNPQAALATAQKASGATATNPAPQSYNGSSYQRAPDDPTTVFGTVGNFLVEGSEASFRAAVDANKGLSLGDEGDFKDAIGNLPDDRLGTFYTVPKTLIASLPAGQFGASQQALLQKTAGDQLDKPVSGALTASADNIDLEFVGGSNGVETPESSLIGSVPSQSWLALGIGDLGKGLQNTINQLKDSGVPGIEQGLAQIQAATGASIDQLAAALGDAVLYVQGTKQQKLSGALVIHTNDPSLTGRLLGQLQSLVQLGAQGVKPLTLSGGGTGFQINSPSVAPAPIEIAQQGDKLVVGYGAGSVAQSVAPAQDLNSSATFSAAKGQVSSLGTDFFLSFPAVFQLAENGGAKKDPGFRQAKPYLDALSYLVSGSGTKGDQTELKAVVGLK